jgi:hypothetical protein
MAKTESAYDLTEAEKRDLIKLIEQGKPLPEKFRFILFDDKREVELVWNGKSREVCTAVLPFQTLEHIDEPRKETKPLTRSSTTLSPSDGERDGVRGDFVVPSVVHWKVGHYAALVRQEGDRYLLEDPTFGNTVWATRDALEAETSGYFLIPAGALPGGWRSVDAKEGASVWGKGITTGNDGDI